MKPQKQDFPKHSTKLKIPCGAPTDVSFEARWSWIPIQLAHNCNFHNVILVNDKPFLTNTKLILMRLEHLARDCIFLWGTFNPHSTFQECHEPH